MPSASTARQLAVLAAIVGLSACASPPPPAPPLELDVTVTHQSAEPGAAPDIDAAAGRSVRLTVLLLEQLPTDVLGTLSSSAALVAQPDLPVPVRAVAGPSRGTRFGPLSDPDELLADARAGRWGHARPLTHLEGVLAPDVATVFSLRAEPPIDFDVDGSLRRAGVTLSFRPEADGNAPFGLAELSMLIEARRPTDDDEAIANPERTEVLQTELVDWPLQLDDQPTVLGLVVPSPFPTAHGKALLAVAQLLPPPGPGTDLDTAWQLAVDAARADLALASEQRATRRDPASADLALALTALLSPGDHRGALVFLAAETGTRFAGDVALAGGDDIIADISSDFVESWTGPGDVELRTALAAALVRSTYRVVASRAADNELSSVVRGVVLTYAGEAGRHPALLRDILESSATAEQISDRVIAANVEFLGSSSPSSRVRAYDWLANQQLAPEGYDPLGPRDERRATLDRRRQAAAQERSGP